MQTIAFLSLFAFALLGVDKALCYRISTQPPMPIAFPELLPSANNTFPPYIAKLEQLSRNISVDRVDEQEDVCVLRIPEKSVRKFRRLVHQRDLSFVYLRLNMMNGLSIGGLEDTVDPDLWIWTFHGNKGGYEFLSWPMDFGVWSMGLLNIFVGGPLGIKLFNVSGDCSNLMVGDNKTDLAITKALTNLTKAMVETDAVKDDEKYETSYFCFKKKLRIEPDFVFNLCRNVICPIQSLAHSCRSFQYNSKKLSIQERLFSYDSIWWVGPLLIAVMLFSLSPFFLLRLVVTFREYFLENNRQSEGLNDRYVCSNEDNQITVVKAVFTPLLAKLQHRCCFCKRFLRCLLPFISLSLVGLQIILDFRYLHGVVFDSVDKCIHMGFRSMLAGYTRSSENFLPIFGGPFVACGIYILIACILLLFPKSVSNTLENGLLDTDTAPQASPLSLPTQILEKYGSVLIQDKRGYMKVYCMLLAKFNLCINTKFWQFVFHVQQKRMAKFNKSRLRSILLPFFVSVCVLELMVCGIIYGFPIFSFGVLIFRSYRILFRQYIPDRLHKVLVWFLEGVLLVSIVFFFFMFCTIFLDAFRFLSRLCIFTFTAVVVYPSRAYGYIIFVATTVYYISEYLHGFSSYYSDLLRLIVEACVSIQKETSSKCLVQTVSNHKGIKASLFYAVVDMYAPVRKRVLVSLLWFSLTIYILDLAVHLITQRNEMRELHTIMHVMTAIFVCAVPKLIKSMCNSGDNRQQRRRQKEEIKTIIRCYLNNLSDYETP